MLSLALVVALTQNPWPPRAPPPTFFTVQVDERDRVLARIMAIDAQLGRVGPSWTTPVLIGSFVLGAAGFGLASVLGRETSSSGAVLALLMGVLVGSAGTIAGIIAGLFGYGEASRRGELDRQRQRLLDEYDRLEHGVNASSYPFR